MIGKTREIRRLGLVPTPGLLRGEELSNELIANGRWCKQPCLRNDVSMKTITQQSRRPRGHIRVLGGRVAPGSTWQPQVLRYTCPSTSFIWLFPIYSLPHNKCVSLSSGSSFSKLSNLTRKGRAVKFPTLQSSWTETCGAWAPYLWPASVSGWGSLHLWTLMFIPSTRAPDLPPEKPVCRSRRTS